MSGSIPQRKKFGKGNYSAVASQDVATEPFATEVRGIVGGPVSYALGVDGTGLVTFKEFLGGLQRRWFCNRL